MCDCSANRLHPVCLAYILCRGQWRGGMLPECFRLAPPFFLSSFICLFLPLSLCLLSFLLLRHPPSSSFRPYFLPLAPFFASSLPFSFPPTQLCDSVKTDVCLFKRRRKEHSSTKTCLVTLLEVCVTACGNKANTIRGIRHLCLSVCV